MSVPRADRCRGSITAEFAILLPAFVLLLAVVLAAGSAATAKLRCIDAARSGSRLAARHESPAVVLAAARAAGPAGAQVQVSTTGDLVRVRVSAEVSLPLPGRPQLGVEATSTALLEDSAGFADSAGFEDLAGFADLAGFEDLAGLERSAQREEPVAK